MRDPYRLTVAQTWDGQPLAATEHAHFDLAWDAQSRVLCVDVDAPFAGDPAPDRAPGPCPGLCEFEVAELFLLGRDDRYLEVELGPHGHHWVLELAGRRHVLRDTLSIRYRASVSGDRWRGRAHVAGAYLPPGLRAVNAYTIRGTVPRRHAAHAAVPGAAPDFHRLECFAPFAGLQAEGLRA